MTMLILNVLGGLAIFIFGMKLMSDGLHRVAGERMRSILRLFSSNRFIGIIAGCVVTAVVQSSSATTVMVIGFVNAGLLSLMQSMGIIFGANIGTTITAQLVAFDISWIIMPSIIIGLALSFIKNRALSNWSETILGLGFLFLGMTFMSDQLKTLSEVEWFKNLFQTFKCAPVDGTMPFMSVLGAIGIGILATVIIQSSSACSGIVVALGASGLVDIYTAVALILGSNIGTTITAQLAALTANRVAKQAALAHTLFNVIGALIMASTFWIVIDGTPIFFKAVDMMSANGTLPRQIANAHTLFNVCTTVILIPAIPLLVKTCEKFIPVKDEKIKYQRLEPHFLSTPSIALSQTTGALRKMLKKSWRMADASLKIYNKNDEENRNYLENLEEHEDDIDVRQKDITSYLSKLMLTELTEEEAEQIPLLLHCTNDAERIGDLSLNIRVIMENITNKKYKFSESAEAEFNDLHERLNAMANLSVKLLATKSPDLMQTAKALKKEMTETLNAIESDHVSRVNSGICRAEVGISYLELLESIRKVSKNLNNIIDRCDNFYERLPKVKRQKESQQTANA